MTTLDFTTDTPHSAQRSSFLVQGFGVASKLFRAWRNRRELYRLGELTDAELKDIGLTRGDLSVARAEPLGADPTLFLRMTTARG